MDGSQVRAGTDWIEVFTLGAPGDRWRADDYDLFLEVKRPGETTALIEASTANGRIVIVDGRSRRIEINVGWELIAAIEPGPFEYDILAANKSTGRRRRTPIVLLTILRGITQEP